jgi:hypothetical protein
MSKKKRNGNEIVEICSEICSYRQVRTFALSALECSGEQVLHGVVMEKNTTQNSKMPDVVATADVVEETRLPTLRNFGGVDEGTDEIDCDALDYWCVEVQAP